MQLETASMELSTILGVMPAQDAGTDIQEAIARAYEVLSAATDAFLVRQAHLLGCTVEDLARDYELESVDHDIVDYGVVTVTREVRLLPRNVSRETLCGNRCQFCGLYTCGEQRGHAGPHRDSDNHHAWDFGH